MTATPETPAPDPETETQTDPRRVALAWGAAHGYPAIQFTPWLTLAAGEAHWLCLAAWPSEHVRLLLAALDQTAPARCPRCVCVLDAPHPLCRCACHATPPTSAARVYVVETRASNIPDETTPTPESATQRSGGLFGLFGRIGPADRTTREGAPDGL